MKKILSIFLALCLCVPFAFALVGCKKGKAAGLYADGKLVATWSQIVNAFPDSFSDDGKTIVGLDYKFLEKFVDGYEEKEGTNKKITFIIDDSVTKIEEYFLASVDIDVIRIPSSVTECETNPFSVIKECDVVIDSAAVFMALSFDYVSLDNIYVLKSVVDENSDAEFLTSDSYERQYWKRYNGKGEYKNYYVFRHEK